MPPTGAEPFVLKRGRRSDFGVPLTGHESSPERADQGMGGRAFASIGRSAAEPRLRVLPKGQLNPQNCIALASQFSWPPQLFGRVSEYAWVRSFARGAPANGPLLCLASPKTRWAKMRVDGSGPPFVKVGRRVLYPQSQADDWFQTRSCVSASEVTQHSSAARRSDTRQFDGIAFAFGNRPPRIAMSLRRSRTKIPWRRLIRRR